MTVTNYPFYSIMYRSMYFSQLLYFKGASFSDVRMKQVQVSHPYIRTAVANVLYKIPCIGSLTSWDLTKYITQSCCLEATHRQ